MLQDRACFDVQTTATPELEPDEILVRVGYCGICGTDLQAYSQLLFPKGSILGHECSGVVSGVGNEVRSVAVGARVVIRPSYICGECEYCLRGDFRLCHFHFERTFGAGAPGGFADEAVVKDYMAIPLPDGVSLAEGTFIEPLACAVHAINMGGVGIGDRVAIYGAGPIGLMVVATVKRAGATGLAVFEKNPARRDAARRLGATSVHALEALDDGSVPTWLRDRGADVSFDCAGVQATLDAAIAYTRPAGTVVLEALYKAPVRVDLASAVPRELALRASIGSTAAEFQAAVDLMASRAIDVSPLISAVIGLGDIDRVFGELTAGRESVKVLVESSAEPEVGGDEAKMRHA